MKITWRKMFREMWVYKGRTFLTMIGILIGVASMGAVLSSYSILSREMTNNFMETNPSSMVFKISNMDSSVIDIVKASYQHTEVVMDKTVQARISRGDGTYGTIYLRSVNDFTNQKADTFQLEKGKYPQNPTEMVLERDCLKILKNLKDGVNQSVNISLPGGKENTIKLSGLVHAPGLAPASMENFSYGFISLDGLKQLGYDGGYDELRIISYDNRLNKNSMEDMASQIKELLSKSGYNVDSVTVPTPGEHPHASQLSSLLFLLQAFAIVALFSASLIIINLITFVMSKQARQIAVMKTLGATTFDIALPFILYVFIISIGGIALGIPLGILAGGGYSEFAAGILNFNIYSKVVPLWAFLVQLLIGILIPILSTLYPVLKSARREINEGLSETISKTPLKKSNKINTVSVNSKFAIPFKNLFRKKSRTVLAILALVAGGTLFITSQNIIVSIDKTVENNTKNFSWDYDLRLSGNYPEETLKNTLSKINGIESVEVWQVNTARILKKENIEVHYTIKIMPDDTKMFMTNSENSIDKIANKDAVIVNTALTHEENWIKAGTFITLGIGERQSKLQVAQVENEAPALPTIYMSRTTYDRLYRVKSNQTIFARANTRSASEQLVITRSIEACFKNSNIILAEDWNIYLLRKAFADHLKVILSFLSIVSFVAVLIGGLSIGSAVGINVSERKRELGVLRAVGVSNIQIVSMVLTEVMLMGILSWIIGALLSYPISVVIGNYFGQIFLYMNLQNVISRSGVFQWGAIAITIALISGFVPAQKVARAPLIDMLKYE